jgi:folate-binding protein YgfZ
VRHETRIGAPEPGFNPSRERARFARRPRAFVRVSGPEAEAYLERMLSNEIGVLAAGDSCEALLLTPKGRVVALLRVFRRGPEDFLLLTEPELGEVVRAHLVRSRFATRAEIEPEEHGSYLLLDGPDGIPNSDYGVSAVEVLDAPVPPGAEEISPDELERMRIEARTPAYGKEIDERVLPAEAGLVERAVSLTKGCYPGQEPIARLHYRGHANRGLRVLSIETDEPPGPDEEIRFEEKVVGRITSAARSDGGVLALGYVRTEVPPDAILMVGGADARPLH